MIMSNATENHSENDITSVELGNRKQALSELASYQKRTVHSLLIEAVDRYIDQAQAKIQYEQDAIRSAILIMKLIS